MLRNVAELADPPSPRRSGAMKSWTAAQLLQFLTEIESHWLATAFHLAGQYRDASGRGSRLAQDDVDLDAGRISVHHLVLNIAYAKSTSDVKTSTSRRTIDLDRRTVEKLRAWRASQEAIAVEAGRELLGDDFIFAKLDGEPIHPDYFSQVFDRHLQKSSLPRIRLHDLRHTHATILLKAGIPVKVVSERLGHSGVHDGGVPARTPRHAGGRSPAPSAKRSSGQQNQRRLRRGNP